MAKPEIVDFLVIGAQKCATTWIHTILDQHPDIFVPAIKEVHYFNYAKNYNRGLEWYGPIMTPPDDAMLVGECTPNYFWNYQTEHERQGPNHIGDIAGKVKQVNPEAKFILVLRNPVDRAVSAYFHHIGQGTIRPDAGIQNSMHLYGIFSMGLYVKHLEHWLQHFPQDRFLTLIYERDIAIKSNNEDTIQRIYRHIGAAPFNDIVFDKARNRRNSYFFMWSTRFIRPASLPGKVLKRLAPKLIPKNLDESFKPVVTPEDYAALDALYQPYNKTLGELTGQDVTRWWGSRE